MNTSARDTLNALEDTASLSRYHVTIDTHCQYEIHAVNADVAELKARRLHMRLVGLPILTLSVRYAGEVRK